MKTYKIGQLEIAAGLQGHVESLEKAIEYMEKLGIDPMAFRMAGVILTKIRGPKKLFASKREAYQAGILDGLIVGARAAFAHRAWEIRQQMVEHTPDGMARCIGCGEAFDLPDGWQEAHRTTTANVKAQLSEQGIDPDDVILNISDNVLCKGCAAEIGLALQASQN